MRTGPGPQYPVKWVYKQPGRPVEIILEYEHWRKIRDMSGKFGWAHKSMLSGTRKGLISGEAPAFIKKRASIDSQTVAQIQPGAIVTLTECNPDWCFAKTGDIQGWIDKQNIWGVYRDEVVD